MYSILSYYGLSYQSATVNWQTNEQTTSTLFYREKNSAEWIEKLSSSFLNHTIALDSLDSATEYEFMIRSTDQAGNTVEDTNAGEYYSFFTDIEAVVWQDTAEAGTTKFVLSGGSNTSGESYNFV